MFSLRLAWRFFVPKERKFVFLLPILCLILGVACLVSTLSVVSGFESSLRRSVIDVTGHVFVTTRRSSREGWSQMRDNLMPTVREAAGVSKENSSGIQSTPFLMTQGIVAGESQLAGIVVQAMEDPKKVVRLSNRLISGELSFQARGRYRAALIGRGLSKKLNIGLGDKFRVVFPINQDLNPSGFTRKVGAFYVSGVIDLGQYRYDERYILTSIEDLRQLLDIADGYSGLLLSLPRDDLASRVSRAINDKFVSIYRSRDWFQANRNLFQAIVIEKRIIFLVVSIITIVAIFNIASTLFISVVQKYREIAVLKSFGLRRGTIVSIFLWQGFFVGLMGIVGGVLLGLGFNQFFEYLLQHHLEIPGDVYKLNKLDLEVRLVDLLQISFFTMVMCLLATLAPALNGARILITRGLRYD